MSIILAIRINLQNIQTYLARPYSIAPLVTFRILFGALMGVGALRFMQQGWIEKLYVEPRFFFKFYGFEWVEVLSPTGMYLLYSTIAISAFLVMLGCFYRLAILLFFLSFTYAELIDATNYLNHHYLVCLLAFLLLFLPAHRAYAVDSWRRPQLRISHLPAYYIYALMLQIGIVYFYAGFAKLNYDWLCRAMPLAIWLPTKTAIPLLTSLFQQTWVAFAFSWTGAFYDLFIVFFLLYAPTRPYAYAAVVAFHLLTKLLFNIGLFPFIMIFSTLVFFSPSFHERLLAMKPKLGSKTLSNHKFSYILFMLFAFHFAIQILLPLRHYCYAGDVLWTEQGYRFSWRVMLVEKLGQATFYIKDGITGQESEVTNSDYLTEFQEKQMAIQPDFILQFAQHLAQDYQSRYGFQQPKVSVDCHVALNGRTSKRFIAKDLDLLKLDNDCYAKEWILKD